MNAIELCKDLNAEAWSKSRIGRVYEYAID